MTYNSELLDRTFNEMRVQWDVDAAKKAGISWEYRYNQLMSAFNGYAAASVWQPAIIPQAAWDYLNGELPSMGYADLQTIFDSQSETVENLEDWPIPFVSLP